MFLFAYETKLVNITARLFLLIPSNMTHILRVDHQYISLNSVRYSFMSMSRMVSMIQYYIGILRTLQKIPIWDIN